MTLSLQEISDRLELEDLLHAYTDCMTPSPSMACAIFLQRMPMSIIPRLAVR